jgi:hypothetical protein
MWFKLSERIMNTHLYLYVRVYKCSCQKFYVTVLLPLWYDLYSIDFKIRYKLCTETGSAHLPQWEIVGMSLIDNIFLYKVNS